jgi:hypothetical protein
MKLIILFGNVYSKHMLLNFKKSVKVEKNFLIERSLKLKYVKKIYIINELTLMGLM